MLRALTDNSIAVTVVLIVFVSRVHKVISVHNKVRVRDDSNKELWTLIGDNPSLLILRVSEIETGWGDELQVLVGETSCWFGERNPVHQGRKLLTQQSKQVISQVKTRSRLRSISHQIIT